MSQKNPARAAGAALLSNADCAEPANSHAAFAQYRGLLFSIAYRMLGSVADAEDMVQEAFLRWQRVRHAEVESPRAFLVTTVSRLCINHLQSARVRRETYIGPWLPEPLLTEMDGDPMEAVLQADETLSMAFLILLERLTPLERAVFLLREVFEYEFAEVAAIIGRSEANCRQILRRSRQHVNAARPRYPASAQKQQDLLGRFLEAARLGDLAGLVSLLSEDVVLHTDGGGKAAALPTLVHGADKVARAVIGGVQKFGSQDLRLRLTQLNGEPGHIGYRDGVPQVAVTLGVSEGRVSAIYVLTNPEKLAHLALAPETNGEGDAE